MAAAALFPAMNVSDTRLRWLQGLADYLEFDANLSSSRDSKPSPLVGEGARRAGEAAQVGIVTLLDSQTSLYFVAARHPRIESGADSFLQAQRALHLSFNKDFGECPKPDGCGFIGLGAMGRVSALPNCVESQFGPTSDRTWRCEPAQPTMDGSQP